MNITLQTRREHFITKIDDVNTLIVFKTFNNKWAWQMFKSSRRPGVTLDLMAYDFKPCNTMLAALHNAYTDSRVINRNR